MSIRICDYRYLVLLLVLSCANLADAIEFKLTVTGGDRDAYNVPVQVPLDIDIDTPFVAISNGDYNFMGQISEPGLLADSDKPVLTFILPSLEEKEETTLYVKTVSNGEATRGFMYDDNAGKFNELSFGDRPVLRYMYEALDKSSPERIGETYKVYHHVYDPTGSRFVTKGAGGKFPHHRGLFFGFNRISYGDHKADIWHCRKGEHQLQKDVLKQVAGPVVGRQLLAIDWYGQHNDVFIKEQRELTAYNVDGGLLIEFATELTSQVGDVRLDGDPQHAGFQFRGSQDIPDKTAHLTYYLRPDGKGEPGKFRNWSDKKNDSEQNLKHINLPWLAQSFVLDDKRYTCCYIDHPNNPKPARFSERDYGRFGSYFEYDLTVDKPLKLNYRIWLQEGEMTVDEVNQISQSFVSPPAVTVSQD